MSGRMMEATAECNAPVDWRVYFNLSQSGPYTILCVDQ